MNNYQAEKTQQQWLSDNGINNKWTFVDPAHIVQAQQVAHNILKHHGHMLGHKEAATLNNYLKAVRNTKLRKRLKLKDAQRVMNIGAAVNRKLFKQLRQLKSTNA